MGRVAVGFQYEWVRREAFAGVFAPTAAGNGVALNQAGSVHTDDQAVFASLRWYPF
jgi:hypothetical protein